MDLLVGVGEQQKPGSRTRLEFLKVSKRLAKLLRVEGTDRLDDLKRLTSRKLATFQVTRRFSRLLRP